MTLPFELTTLPPQALDILRYMGRTKLEQADANELIEGTGFTERSFSKGIKRLVTKNYMMMDEARVYHLTQKGHTAIEDIAAHDAVTPQSAQQDDDQPIVEYDLCVVMASPLAAEGSTPMMLGLEPGAMDYLTGQAQLILRLDAVNADVDPREFAATLSPDMPVVMAQFDVTPALGKKAIRLRIEAFQTLRMDELEEVGGMYADFKLNEPVNRPQALHTVLDIVQ